jgi:excisionase family DNA binding protein
MQEPIFHTVQEAARILRVDAATIYRSIRAGSFPAIRIRSRYVIPAAALREVAAKAVSSGTCVDLTRPGSAHRGRPSLSLSVDAVARDVPPGRTLRHP